MAGQTMGWRIGTLIVIDVLMVAGLGVLVFFDHDHPITPIVACIGVISYVSYSIVQLRAKAKAAK
jgi:hypothetical protein